MSSATWAVYNGNAETITTGLQSLDVCDEARIAACGLANARLEAVYYGPEDAEWDDLFIAAPTHVRCGCGEATGERCGWTGPESETVLVEWMPEQHRESYRKARNRGVYPHNGAVRFRAHPNCAESLVEHDGDWTEIVP